MAGLSDFYELFVNGGITHSILWALDGDDLKSIGANLIQIKRYSVAVKTRNFGNPTGSLR